MLLALPKLRGQVSAGHSWRILAADSVAAGFAASATVPKPISAQPDIQLALTEDAVFFALAAFFDLFALAAADFDFGGGHVETLSLARKLGKVPLVTRVRLRDFGSRLWALAKSATLGTESLTSRL